MNIALGVALILALTAATGYFVAQEFAYVAVDRDALRLLAREGDAPAERALRVTSRLSFALSAAQFGITVTALLVGYVSEPLVGTALAEALSSDLSYAARLSISVAAVMTFSTVVQMVFGELAPKNLAIARTVGVARALSRSTLIYLTVIGPLVRWFDASSTWLLRRIGIEPVEELGHGATAEDLGRIIIASHAGGLLDDDLSGLLAGGLRVRELEAEDVMTPRVRVQTLRREATVADLLQLLGSGRSRFPVIGDDGDDILGVVGIAEILAVPVSERATTTVGSIAAPPTVVPTSAPVTRVLEQIRIDHRQLAIVVDEHGGFAGIVTFEDIAEEVVGDIFDEDEPDDPGIHDHPDGGWTTPGHVRLDELAKRTGLGVSSDDEYTTMSGLVLELLGRTAQSGDVLETIARRAADESGSSAGDRPGDRSPADDGAPVRDRDRDRGHDQGRDRKLNLEEAQEVAVRLTVCAVDRHVPSLVRVEVIEPAHHSLPASDADADAANGHVADGHSVHRGDR